MVSYLFDGVGHFFYGKLVRRRVVRRVLRGVQALLDRVVRLSLHKRKNEPVAGVDSIDIIIVGLGLFLILMVLLRR